MKVIVIHNHPIHYKHLLFQELTKGGVDLEVIFAARVSDVRHEKISLSPNLYRYRVGFDGPWEKAPAFSRLLFAWRAAREIKPDVVITSSYYKIECWIAWLWAIIHRRPIIMWFESNRFDYARKWYKELLKRIFVSQLSGAHVYGLSSRAYLERLGMNRQRITLKRAVVDVEKFNDVPIGRSYSTGRIRRLVYVGRLAPEKNVSFVLRSLAKANSRLQTPDLFLTVVGTGPLEQELRCECVDLGIEQFVEFTGYRPQNELRSLLLGADCLVLPSIREPWGLVSLEAMLCRLPVMISTQCGCAADVVTPDSGWSFSPFEEEEFIALLIKLPEMSLKRIREMGNCARLIALDYSAASCAQRVIGSLAQVTSRSTHGRVVRTESGK